MRRSAPASSAATPMLVPAATPASSVGAPISHLVPVKLSAVAKAPPQILATSPRSMRVPTKGCEVRRLLPVEGEEKEAWGQES